MKNEKDVVVRISHPDLGIPRIYRFPAATAFDEAEQQALVLIEQECGYGDSYQVSLKIEEEVI